MLHDTAFRVISSKYHKKTFKHFEISKKTIDYSLKKKSILTEAL